MNDGEQISCHRWKRYVLLIFLSTIPGVALAKNCIQIKNIGASSVPVLQLVRKPGRYCLAKHIHQEIVTRSYTRSRLNLENSYLLATVGSRIELDLMGLAITSSFQSLQGVGQNGLSAILHEKSNAGRYLPPQNLKLINGRIELAGRSEGVSIPRMSPGGSIHADFHPLRYRDQVDEPGFSLTSVLASIRPRLAKVLTKDTLIQIDNMTFKTGLTGITIMGRKNTIRNSRIEVSNPRAGIYLFGGHNLIENNILIFRGKALNDSAAPIKLHAGDGTVIRNNVIIFDTAPARAAVSLIESRHVVLMNNRVYGGSELVRVFDQLSSFTAVNNRLHAKGAAPQLTDTHRRADQLAAN